jgi:carbonic anhydrase
VIPIKSGLGVLLAILILASPSRVQAQTFGYFGDLGPVHWGDLSSDWLACKVGQMQSPVDFGHPKHHPPVSHRRLNIDYGFTTGEIFNNGHTVEVEAEGDNTLTLGGVEYELVQFHFHTPSEHRVDGLGYDMELHLVHRSDDGSNAVMGVFLRRGGSSGALAPIFANLPDDLDVHHPLPAGFDPAAFLPKSRTHYRYLGSLTTPPCSEGVRWIVMTEPVTVSDEDMAQFAERIHFNARFVQRSFR